MIVFTTGSKCGTCYIMNGMRVALVALVLSHWMCRDEHVRCAAVDLPAIISTDCPIISTDPRDCCDIAIGDTVNLPYRDVHIPSSPNVVYKKPKHHRGSIYCIAWSLDGEVIATGSNDKIVKLLRVDPMTGYPVIGEQEIELTHHSGIIRDLTFVQVINWCRSPAVPKLCYRIRRSPIC